MNRAAQGMLRRALAEQMEKEAAMVPSDEIIQKSHRFSKKFLRNMGRLKQNCSENENKEDIIKGDAKIRGKKKRNPEKWRMYASIAALCACCVIAVGITWRGLTIPKGNSGSVGMSMADSVDASSTESTAGKPETAVEEGWMPFSDLTMQEIAQVEAESFDKQSAEQGVYSESKDESNAEKKEGWKGLADILNGMVVFEEISTDSLQNIRAQYRMQKTDGTDIVISVYDEAVIIDGVGYRTDAEACRQLVLLAEEIREAIGEE